MSSLATDLRLREIFFFLIFFCIGLYKGAWPSKKWLLYQTITLDACDTAEDCQKSYMCNAELRTVQSNASEAECREWLWMPAERKALWLCYSDCRPRGRTSINHVSMRQFDKCV